MMKSLIKLFRIIHCRISCSGWLVFYLFIYYVIFTQEYPISAQHCSPWGSCLHLSSLTYRYTPPPCCFVLHTAAVIWVRLGKWGQVGKKWHFTLSIVFNVMGVSGTWSIGCSCAKHRVVQSSLVVAWSALTVGSFGWQNNFVFLRYPQYTSHILCFYHVLMNTYNLL